MVQYVLLLNYKPGGINAVREDPGCYVVWKSRSPVGKRRSSRTSISSVSTTSAS